MRPQRFLLSLGLLLAALATPAYAAESQRWTGAEDTDGSIEHVLAELSQRNGYALTAGDFVLGEDRLLATSRYRRYDQVAAGVAIRSMAVRIWTELPERGGALGKLIQLEAQTEAPAVQPVALLDLESVDLADEQAALSLARAQVARSDDTLIRDVELVRTWDAGRLIFAVTVKGRRGERSIDVDAVTHAVIRNSYRPFANADHDGFDGADAQESEGGKFARELSVPALVYPVYEEYRGQLLPRQRARLRYLSREILRPSSDPFGPLRNRQYFYKLHDNARGENPIDRAAGYWSMAWLRRQVETLRQALPRTPNRFDANGLLLSGRYATINIHPEAFTKFSGVTLPLRPSSQVLYVWKEDKALDDYEIIPTAAGLGQPLANRRSALERDATRLPDHPPAAYINAGFDEVQVYYAINEMFDALRPMGFTDPDLSERPFHAFLFDPDIEMQDNAYYTDDTINFTTYSPSQMNMARDNTTIWHELGHGVMDRMMGDRLRLADTGGLSEGMADFVAELVLQAATSGRAFPGSTDQRIINSTGFFLTNEVHDDGEAYGGAMKSILDLALAKFGRQGLVKVSDVVLEAMRLSRDHPALTADVWFEHLRFADARGHRGVRAPGELRELIEQALAARNFADEQHRGQYLFSYDGKEVTADAPGSRGNGIPIELAPNDTSTHTLEISAKDGDGFKYVWPVEVRVFFNSGPLQGALDWVGEDTEPTVYVLNGPSDVLQLPLTVRGTCDAINRTDGTCSDFAYVQLWNHGATQPVAKKRFYLHLKTL